MVMAFRKFDAGISRDERLPVILFILFVAVLCFAGGASRGDVFGQVVVRGAAVAAMLTQVVFGRSPDLRRYRAGILFLGSIIAITAVQLVPLPPSVWTALPGRSLIASSPWGATTWRPLNLVPDAGWNALYCLLVPLCVIFLLSSMRTTTVWRARHVLIAACVFSALWALLQAAGSVPDNPLINGTTTDYGGIFANRNHQALFLAIGILLSWFWGADGATWRDRRLWLTVAIIALLFVSILVTGSRSGAILGAMAVVVGPVAAFTGRPERSFGRRQVLIWSAGSLFIAIGILLVSIYFGRAASLDRAATLALGNEFRIRSAPTVWELAKSYFPFGAGMGSFDNVFRIVEPFSLLEPTYLNHAHNDFLEMVIETGVIGPIVLITGLAWAVRRLVASRRECGESVKMARLGALVIALVLLASLSDYPVRTPMMMFVLIMASCWLAGDRRRDGTRTATDALPGHTDPL